MNSYTKELKIKVDSSEVKALKEQIDSIYVDTLSNATKELKSLELKGDPTDFKRVTELRDAITKLNTDFGKDNQNNPFSKENIKKMAKDNLKKMFVNLGESIVNLLEDSFSNAISRLEDMASYDLQNSLFFNRSAYDQMLEYGIMDPSQNYALTQAMGEFGLNSQEDIASGFYDRDKFAERIGYYTDYYRQLADKDFFRTFQEFQLEWSNFKTELEMSMISFFMDNKDLIQDVLKGLIDFMHFVMQAIDGIRNFFRVSGVNDNERAIAAQGIVDSYSYSNQSTRNNVNINNNLYPNSQTLTDKSALERAGQVSYAQLISALEGS